jgi:hypothetical protein
VKNLQKAQKQTSGGHIHLGIDHLSYIEQKRLFRKIVTYFCNRPWLGWAINDPSDNTNSKNWQNLGRSFRKGYRLLLSDEVPCKGWKDSDFNGRKGRVVNLRSSTIEFRIFEMPINYLRCQQHLDLAFAIFQYCKNHPLEKLNPNYTPSNRIVKNPKFINQIPLSVSQDGLEKTFIELGYDPQHFKWAFYNLEDRYSFGIEYLV